MDEESWLVHVTHTPESGKCLRSFKGACDISSHPNNDFHSNIGRVEASPFVCGARVVIYVMVCCHKPLIYLFFFSFLSFPFKIHVVIQKFRVV